MNDKNEFAIKICELRKRKRLSQKELGEMVGVSNKAVSKWENGDAMPQMKTVVKLSEIFGTDVSYLLSANNADNQSN